MKNRRHTDGWFASIASDDSERFPDASIGGGEKTRNRISRIRYRVRWVDRWIEKSSKRIRKKLFAVETRNVSRFREISLSRKQPPSIQARNCDISTLIL